tara:strand:- start:2901 stop:5024 length:2124 start_codon:yes stop_codon:yes gene_type:complete
MNKGFGSKKDNRKENNDKASLIKKGLRCQKEGELEMAEKYYKEFLELGYMDCRISINYAQLLKSKNKYNDAINLLESTIQAYPKQIEAYISLINTYIEKKQDSEAIELLRKAIKIESNSIQLYNTLASLLYNSKKYTEAEKTINTSLNINPNNSKSILISADILFATKKYENSIFYMNRALKLFYKSDELHYKIGKAYQLINNNKLAIHHYTEANKLNDQELRYINDLASLLKRSGDYEKAIKIYEKALSIHQENESIYFNIGNIFLETKNYNLAIYNYEKSIQLNSKIDKFYFNLSKAYLGNSQVEESIRMLEKCIDINDRYIQAYSDLGKIYLEKEEIDKSIIYFEKALQIEPTYFKALNNIACSYMIKGSLETAKEYFQKILLNKPNQSDVHKNYSFTLLSSGDYINGLKEYEWRLKSSQLEVKPKTPQWRGILQENDEELLIISEQGLGDTIQFIRYIKYLKENNMKYSLCIQEKLHELIKISGLDSNPFSKSTYIESNNKKWIPLLSLPMYLGVTPTRPLVIEPYINIKDNIYFYWKERLNKGKKPLIGINWQGNPDTENNILKGRSIPFDIFEKILFNKNLSFVSLQKGFGSHSYKSFSNPDVFLDAQSEIDKTWDFHQSASIIKNCDLIITSDTVVAHLAGAMGVKTWLLLHYVPDWRWGTKGNKTFWYPSVKIFRQSNRGNWKELMQKVSDALKSEFIL